MCLPSLPRLQSQARHIPVLHIFILKICTEIKISPWKIDVSRTKFEHEESFYTP